MSNLNTNNEEADKSEAGPQIQAARMSPEQQLKKNMSENMQKLRVYWSPEDVKDLEGSMRQIDAMLDNRLKRKKEIIVALRQGKKAPVDINPADSTFRQSYNNFELHAAKYLTIGGFAGAYRDLMKNFDDYIDFRRKEIKTLDATIKDLNAEKGKRGQDKAKEDEIRKMLSEKKAA